MQVPSAKSHDQRQDPYNVCINIHELLSTCTNIDICVPRHMCIYVYTTTNKYSRRTCRTYIDAGS